MIQVIICNRGEESTVIRQHQYSFIIGCIVDIGISKEALGMMPESGDELSVDSKIQFRKLLKTYSVRVVDLMNNGVDIFVGQQKVGGWRLISTEMKKSNEEPLVGLKSRLYIELSVETITLQEENDRKTNHPSRSDNTDESSF